VIRLTAPAMWNSSKVDFPNRENLSQLSDNRFANSASVLPPKDVDQERGSVCQVLRLNW
jgi:hypothetical protein